MPKNQTTTVAILLAVALGCFLLPMAWGQPTDNSETTDAPADGAVAVDSQPSDSEPTDSAPAINEAPKTTTSSSQTEDNTFNEVYYPLIVLTVGIVTVLGLIVGFKVNAFIALITAAIVVSLMAPGSVASKIGRVATDFGASAGGIGIVIGMAAVIGKCMLDSGAADRIVRFFLGVFGEKRSPVALLGSGFVLAVPVFFDTVFYLLVPLARSLHRKTGKNYLLYILAIGAGGALTHTLVPPTPGPLLMAENLGVEVGWMILAGLAVAAPTAVVGLLVASLMQRIMQTPMRTVGSEPEPEPLKDSELPPLWLALAPVVLPVIMISANTVMTYVADAEHAARIRVSDIQNFEAFTAKLRDASTADEPSPGKLVVEHLQATAVSSAADDDRAALALAINNLRAGEMTEDDRKLIESFRTKAPKEGDEEESAELSEQTVAVNSLDVIFNESAPIESPKEALVAGLNRILLNKQFFDEQAFVGVLIEKDVRKKLVGSLVRTKPVDVERLNRRLFEAAFPKHIQKHQWNTTLRSIANYTALFGNANLALLISTIIAMIMLVKQRGLSREELAKAVETALMSGGVIILITAGGGAFGAMLTHAKVGGAIESLFSNAGDWATSGMAFLVLGFLIALILKVAQGSSTVAMIVGSAMVAAIIEGQPLPYNAMYLATAIGAGSLVGSWMNDSGFWIFAKMGGLTEGEALKSWTILLSILGLVSFAFSLLWSYLVPLV